MNSVEYNNMLKRIEELKIELQEMWVKSKELEPKGIRKQLKRTLEYLRGCSTLMLKYKEVNTFGKRWKASD